MENRSRKAFTLVELAIVIVIIGFLVGGVLQGQELINQAKIRKDIKKISSIQAAIYTFLGKYNFIPGDYPNNLALNSFNVGGGNGDGRLEWSTGASDSVYFWLHLVSTKMLNVVNWDGSPYPTTSSRYAKFRDDKGLYSGTMYAVTGDIYQSNPAIGVNVGNAITISTYLASGNQANYAAIPASTARAIDEKIDDSKPTTGKLKGANGLDTQTNATTVCFTGTEYVNEDSKEVCRILFEF